MTLDTNLDEIHLRECLQTCWFLDIEDRDDILMVKVSQKLHLSERPQAEHGMIKWRDLLDGNLLARRFVNCRAGRYN